MAIPKSKRKVGKKQSTSPQSRNDSGKTKPPKFTRKQLADLQIYADEIEGEYEYDAESQTLEIIDASAEPDIRWVIRPSKSRPGKYECTGHVSPWPMCERLREMGIPMDVEV